MRDIKEILEQYNLSSQEIRDKSAREFEEYEKTKNYEDINKHAFENRVLFVNYKGKGEFYHEIETWPKLRKSLWIADVIEESLRSFNSNELVKAIEKVVGKCQHYTEHYDIPGLVRIRIPGYRIWLNKILEICQFYRYYISFIDGDILFFEPVLTAEVTKEIKKDYGNKVYHLCNPEDVDSILKNGLIVSGATGRDVNNPLWYMAGEDLKDFLSKIEDNTIRKRIQKHTTYRIFPNRVFVFYTNIDPEDAKNIICDITNFSKDRVIIEIDLQQHNIPFFVDRSMREHDGVKFAYSNIDIPPKLLKLWKN